MKSSSDLSPSGRCRFGQGTFGRAPGDDGFAPKSAVRWIDARVGSTRGGLRLQRAPMGTVPLMNANHPFAQ
jgi:hypothetical protein